MNELKVFKNSEFGELGVLVEGDKPLFPASESAKMLGYTNPVDAIRRHCKGVVKRDVPTSGGIQRKNFITEGDLYRLIAHSKLPGAERFERWAFDDVLPTIRKHGMYMTQDVVEGFLANPDTMIQALTAYRDEKARRIAAESEKAALAAKLEEAAPKIAFADDIAASPDCITMGEYAKLLNNVGITIGRTRLYKIFREKGIILKDGRTPSQTYVKKGWLALKEYPVFNKYGSYLGIERSPMITGLGQRMLLEMLRKEFAAA